MGFVSALIGSSLLFSPSLSANAGEKNGDESRLASLAKFTKVLGTIEKYYVDDMTLNDIVSKAIEGLLSSLDAHSSFLDEKKFKNLKIQTEGEFGGLGITVGVRDGALTVIAPIEGTPADKAGLKSKDIILKIDEKSTLNMTTDEAVSLMRGKPKTETTLTIVRKGENKPFPVKIVRDIIKIDSVYSKIIEKENILYIRITSFDKKVVGDTKKAISQNPGVKGVIIDLRNNPGGLLNQAVGLSDLFIDKGIIVSQKGRIERENKEYKATTFGTVKKIPLVVLVNSGSASASEIVSGALQDHKRAVIIGEKTFGKGSVQIILPINKEEALRLTIARYYLPSGRTIQAVGITPDIIVHAGEVPKTVDEYAIKESELKKHLEGELKKIENGDKKDKKQTNKTNKKQNNVIKEQDIYKDMQLKSGVDVIKVLTLTNGFH